MAPDCPILNPPGLPPVSGRPTYSYKPPGALPPEEGAKSTANTPAQKVLQEADEGAP